MSFVLARWSPPIRSLRELLKFLRVLRLQLHGWPKGVRCFAAQQPQALRLQQAQLRLQLALRQQAMTNNQCFGAQRQHVLRRLQVLRLQQALRLQQQRVLRPPETPCHIVIGVTFTRRKAGLARVT